MNEHWLRTNEHRKQNGLTTVLFSRSHTLPVFHQNAPLSQSEKAGNFFPANIAAMPNTRQSHKRKHEMNKIKTERESDEA